MSVKKPGIPSMAAVPSNLVMVLGPMKENIELLTGVRGGPLAPLSSAATNTQIIAAINTIIARLNSTGT